LMNRKRKEAEIGRRKTENQIENKKEGAKM
jgi:hypothetical protein